MFAALSGPNRLRIVELLMEREGACGEEVAAGAGYKPLALLAPRQGLGEAGLITRRKRAKPATAL